MLHRLRAHPQPMAPVPPLPSACALSSRQQQNRKVVHMTSTLAALLRAARCMHKNHASCRLFNWMHQPDAQPWCQTALPAVLLAVLMPMRTCMQHPQKVRSVSAVCRWWCRFARLRRSTTSCSMKFGRVSGVVSPHSNCQWWGFDVCFPHALTLCRRLTMRPRRYQATCVCLSATSS